MKFTKRQQAILVGTILGDAYLQKTGKRNARLRLEQGEKQKDYLLWKAGAFKRLFQGESVFLKRIHPDTKRSYGYWRFQSNSTPELGKLRQIFYQNGKKIIPQNLEQLLNEPLSLAVWYMDDGYYYQRDKCSYLYLGKVSLNEAEIVKKTLERNFVIEGRILDKKNKGMAIYFSPPEAKKLKRIIGRIIIPSLSYKIPS